MSSPLLALPGAVGGDAPDQAVAAHYGAISAEQRRLADGHTFVDLSHRDVVTITGPDRLTWLHSLTTQFLENLAPGVPTEVLLLSPQGRIEHGFSGVDDGETFWAHTEPGAGAALVEFLDRMRFMLRVEVALASDEWAVIGLPGLRWDLRPRASLADLPGELGDPVGTWAWEAERIEAGLVRVGMVEGADQMLADLQPDTSNVVMTRLNPGPKFLCICKPLSSRTTRPSAKTSSAPSRS